MATERDPGTRHLRLRKAVAWILLAVCAVYLVPPPPPETLHPHRIPVVFWHALDGEWQPIYEGMVRRFNESQDRYEVIPACLPGDQLSMKFLLSASGGNSPDILLDWDPVLGTWSDLGLIQPIENLMTPLEKRTFLSTTYPIIRQNSIYKGKIMALVDGLDLYAIYYRMDDLKEVGVDEQHLPKTLDELVQLGKKLDRYDSSGRLRRVGFLPGNFAQWAPVFGGGFNKGGQIRIDSPHNLAAMKFIAERLKAYGFDAVTRFQSSMAADAGPNIPMIAGNYSIKLDGEWRVKQIAQYRPELPYVVAPVPAPADGVPNASLSAPNYLLIPTAAHEPKGAWEFAKFCVGFLHPEDGGRNMGEMGWLPNDPAIAASHTYQQYLKKYPKYKVFVDLMSSTHLQIPPQGRLQAFVTDEMTKAEDRVARGTLTPTEALQTIETHLADEKQRLTDLGDPIR